MEERLTASTMSSQVSTSIWAKKEEDEDVDDLDDDDVDDDDDDDLDDDDDDDLEEDDDEEE